MNIYRNISKAIFIFLGCTAAATYKFSEPMAPIYYDNEYGEYEGKQLSLHQIPVLSDGEKVFGSQFGDFNHAVVDQGTRKIWTVVFGFGLSFDHLNSFADRLIELKNSQEQFAGTTTHRMQIFSGYPFIYDFDLAQTPSIFCALDSQTRSLT